MNEETNKQNIDLLRQELGNEIDTLYKIFRERKPEGTYGKVIPHIRRQQILTTYRGREVKIGTIIDLYDWGVLTASALLGMYMLIQKGEKPCKHPQFASSHRNIVLWMVETGKRRVERGRIKA